MTLVNTVVANNGATNCSGPVEAAGSGHNLDSANTCGFGAAGDKINQDPLLGALSADGTRPLGGGSPAIDAGDSSGPNCPEADERGVLRPQDGDGNGSTLFDMGAYEVAVADSAALTISPQGAGSGNIIGQGSVGGAGIIDCDWNGAAKSGTCVYASGGLQSIQLAATAAAGSTFFGWTNCPGAVTGTGGNICTYSITASTDDFDIKPKFDLAANTLTVNKTGSGTGTVTSVDGNINCGPTCAHGYAPGTAVTLNAAAAAGSRFVRWLGACTGTPVNQPCLLTMTTARNVTAEFANTHVDADVLGARFLKKDSGKRYARVKIDATEEVDVRVRVIKNGRVRAGKNVNNFGPGTGAILLKLGRGVPGGNARIQIVVTDNDGNTKTVNRTAAVPNR